MASRHFLFLLVSLLCFTTTVLSDDEQFQVEAVYSHVPPSPVPITKPSPSYLPPKAPTSPAKPFAPPTKAPAPPVKPYTPPTKAPAPPVKPYTPPTKAPAPPVKPYTPPPKAPSPPLKPYTPLPKTPSPPVKPYSPPPKIPSPPAETPPSPIIPYRPPVKKEECVPLCEERCKLHSRKRLCMRACSTCCIRCKCVPPGTYGNRELCGKCYTDMTTHGNRPKCP
ncbi:hypothetical protein Ancab_023388 [Ancistrocladus abbreviatus]